MQVVGQRQIRHQNSLRASTFRISDRSSHYGLIGRRKICKPTNFIALNPSTLQKPEMVGRWIQRRQKDNVVVISKHIQTMWLIRQTLCRRMKGTLYHTLVCMPQEPTRTE